MLQSPLPVINNDCSPKGLLLLLFFENTVMFEKYNYIFSTTNLLAIDTNFALISYRRLEDFFVDQVFLIVLKKIRFPGGLIV